MTPVTIYLASKPEWPLRGVRDDAGNLRVGAAGGWEFSRPLTEHEVARVEEVRAKQE